MITRRTIVGLMSAAAFLGTVGDDRYGLLQQFAWEMYVIARPTAKH